MARFITTTTPIRVHRQFPRIALSWIYALRAVGCDGDRRPHANANLCDENRGLTNVGFRIGRRW